MKLNISYGAYSGAYSSFNRWRNELAKAAGYKIDASGYIDLDWEKYPDETVEGIWKENPEDPLIILFVHSDCDYRIFPAQLEVLVPRLEELLLKLPYADTGHHVRYGGIWEVTKRFINGAKLALANKKALEFY